MIARISPPVWLRITATTVSVAWLEGNRTTDVPERRKLQSNGHAKPVDKELRVETRLQEEKQLAVLGSPFAVLPLPALLPVSADDPVALVLACRRSAAAAPAPALASTAYFWLRSCPQGGLRATGCMRTERRMESRSVLPIKDRARVSLLPSPFPSTCEGPLTFPYCPMPFSFPPHRLLPALQQHHGLDKPWVSQSAPRGKCLSRWSLTHRRRARGPTFMKALLKTHVLASITPPCLLEPMALTAGQWDRRLAASSTERTGGTIGRTSTLRGKHTATSKHEQVTRACERRRPHAVRNPSPQRSFLLVSLPMPETQTLRAVPLPPALPRPSSRPALQIASSCPSRA